MPKLTRNQELARTYSPTLNPSICVAVTNAAFAVEPVEYKLEWITTENDDWLDEFFIALHQQLPEYTAENKSALQQLALERLQQDPCVKEKLAVVFNYLSDTNVADDRKTARWARLVERYLNCPEGFLAGISMVHANVQGLSTLTQFIQAYRQDLLERVKIENNEIHDSNAYDILAHCYDYGTPSGYENDRYLDQSSEVIQQKLQNIADQFRRSFHPFAIVSDIVTRLQHHLREHHIYSGNRLAHILELYHAGCTRNIITNVAYGDDMQKSLADILQSLFGINCTLDITKHFVVFNSQNENTQASPIELIGQVVDINWSAIIDDFIFPALLQHGIIELKQKQQVYPHYFGETLSKGESLLHQTLHGAFTPTVAAIILDHYYAHPNLISTAPPGLSQLKPLEYLQAQFSAQTTYLIRGLSLLNHTEDQSCLSRVYQIFLANRTPENSTVLFDEHNLPRAEVMVALEPTDTANTKEFLSAIQAYGLARYFNRTSLMPSLTNFQLMLHLAGTIPLALKSICLLTISERIAVLGNEAKSRTRSMLLILQLHDLMLIESFMLDILEKKQLQQLLNIKVSKKSNTSAFARFIMRHTSSACIKLILDQFTHSELCQLIANTEITSISQAFVCYLFTRLKQMPNATPFFLQQFATTKNNREIVLLSVDSKSFGLIINQLRTIDCSLVQVLLHPHKSSLNVFTAIALQENDHLFETVLELLAELDAPAIVNLFMSTCSSKTRMLNMIARQKPQLIPLIFSFLKSKLSQEQLLQVLHFQQIFNSKGNDNAQLAYNHQTQENYFLPVLAFLDEQLQCQIPQRSEIVSQILGGASPTSAADHQKTCQHLVLRMTAHGITQTFMLYTKLSSYAGLTTIFKNPETYFDIIDREFNNRRISPQALATLLLKTPKCFTMAVLEEVTSQLNPLQLLNSKTQDHHSFYLCLLNGLCYPVGVSFREPQLNHQIIKRIVEHFKLNKQPIGKTLATTSSLPLALSSLAAQLVDADIEYRLGAQRVLHKLLDWMYDIRRIKQQTPSRICLRK